jgi:hypothetical protein
LRFTVCWSTTGVSASGPQLLDAFASAGMDPDQVSVTVCPTVVGTVTLL